MPQVALPAPPAEVPMFSPEPEDWADVSGWTRAMRDQFNENDAPIAPGGNLADDADWCFRCQQAEDRWGRCRCARARDGVHGPEPFLEYRAGWPGTWGDSDSEEEA